MDGLEADPATTRAALTDASEDEAAKYKTTVVGVTSRGFVVGQSITPSCRSLGTGSS